MYRPKLTVKINTVEKLYERVNQPVALFQDKNC